MKEDNLKNYKHAPTHLFLSDFYYFITAGTYSKKRYFEDDGKKNFLYETIYDVFNAYDSALHGWVILGNHYHIIGKFKDAFFLPEVIKKIHSRSAVWLNKSSKKAGRKIWYQYWDECIRDERDYYAKINYIHWNPVRHGYVDAPELYKFSSYNSYLNLRGEEWLNGILKCFPVEEVKNNDDY